MDAPKWPDQVLFPWCYCLAPINVNETDNSLHGKDIWVSVTDISIYWPYSLEENPPKDNSEDDTKDLCMSSACLLLLRCSRFCIGRYLYQKKMQVTTRLTAAACTVCSLCCTFRSTRFKYPQLTAKEELFSTAWWCAGTAHRLAISLCAGWLPPVLSPNGLHQTWTLPKGLI